ncbi:hypothetical protein CN505_00510 [Bacillus cereus]|nr:hypothetical protein CN509_15955 [Bacillus cereus]PET10762.1 hypothetical protein CN505_00510 [Bacillus cereus]
MMFKTSILKTSTLSEITNMASGGTPNRGVLEYWNGDIPWVTTAEVSQNIHITSTKELITELGLKNSSAKVFPVNSILLAMYGQGKTRGKVAMLGIKAATNQACLSILPKTKDLDIDYLYFYLEKSYEKMRKMANTGGQDNLSMALVKEMKISYPPIEFQKKIVLFLKKIDYRLQLQQEKINLLKEQKKGYMQKILKQEIRFKDEDGREYPEWKNHLIGDYIIEYKEVTTINNQYPVLTSSRNGIVFQREHFKNQVTTNENIGYHVLPLNYFTYRSRSDDGKFSFNINEIIEKGIISYFYPVFTLKSNMQSKYFHYYLNNCIQQDIYKEVVGTSQLVLSLNKLKQLNIKVPSVEEQKKISNLIIKFDKKIEVEQQKLDFLQEQKKGFMQQMFI